MLSVRPLASNAAWLNPRLLSLALYDGTGTTAPNAPGTARGGMGTPMPRDGGRLGGLLAVLAILVVLALMAWGMGAPATGGVGAEDANLKAGSGAALVHDDAGNMPATGTGSTVVHDDAGTMAPDAGSVVVHDDAGNVKPY